MWFAIGVQKRKWPNSVKMHAIYFGLAFHGQKKIFLHDKHKELLVERSSLILRTFVYPRCYDNSSDTSECRHPSALCLVHSCQPGVLRISPFRKRHFPFENLRSSLLINFSNLHSYPQRCQDRFNSRHFTLECQ